MATPIGLEDAVFSEKMWPYSRICVFLQTHKQIKMCAISDLPPLQENDFLELDVADYREYLHAIAGHLPKGLEKWL